MDNEINEEYVEIDLREYMMVLINKWKLIVSIFLTVVLLAGGYAFLIAEPVYEAEAQVKLGTNSGNYSDVNFVKNILKADAYWEKIYNQFDLNIELNKLNSYVASNLEVTGNEKIINIKLQSNDSKQSKLILEKLITLFKQDSIEEYNKRLEHKKEYLKEIRNELENLTQEIERKKETFNSLINSDLSTTDKIILNNDFTNKLNKLRELKSSLISKKNEVLSEINKINNVAIINQPVESDEPIKPNKKLILAIAGVLGLMFGIFAAFIEDFLVEIKEEIKVKK